MRDLRKAGLVVAVVMLAGMAAVRAGQPIDINSLPAGTRYCPAPWADNSEFMSSYFSVDVKTGVMTRHDSNSGPVGVTPEPQAKEQVLYVSPPISVENVYVPPRGGPARPPQTMATGVVGQGPQARQRQMRQPAYPQQPRQAYPQPAQSYQQPYPQQAQNYSPQQQNYQPAYSQQAYQQQPYAQAQQYQQNYQQNYQNYPQATANQGRGVATVPSAGYGTRVAR